MELPSKEEIEEMGVVGAVNGMIEMAKNDPLLKSIWNFGKDVVEFVTPYFEEKIVGIHKEIN